MKPKQRSVDLRPSHNRYVNSYPDYDETKQVTTFPDSLFAKIPEKIKAFEDKLCSENDIPLKRSNIHSGKGGIAYYYFRRAIQSQGTPSFSQYLSLSKSFLPSAIDAEKARDKDTFITGQVGLWALGAAIESFSPNPDGTPSITAQKYIDAIRDISQMILAQAPYNELFYGKTGYLYACLFVNSFFKDKVIEDDILVKVAQKVLESGENASNQSEYDDCPLLWKWHSTYLGGAHGFSGILHTLLLVDQIRESPDVMEKILSTIKFCLRYQQPDGQFVSSLESQNTVLVQWCHGSPSWGMFLTEAVQIFNCEENLQIANAKALEHVWKEGLIVKGANICHGISGNAWVFLHAYGITDNQRYLYYLLCFLDFLLEERNDILVDEDSLYSLFDGDLGNILFLSEVLYFFTQSNPTSSYFPGWSL